MPRVVLLGTRYPDLRIEEEVLTPVGIEIGTGPGIGDDEIVAAARGADVILAGSRPTFTRALLERLDTRAIVRAGIGVDSIDLEAARDLGYVIANVPDYGTEAVAQHTLAMALAGTRRLIEADAGVKAGEWGFHDLRPLLLPGSMTAGVIGFGRIGRRVAELLSAVGFGRVLAHDPFAQPEAEDVVVVSRSQVLGESDVVCLHAPGDGGRVIGQTELASMRYGSVLVNTARGALVDAAALASALSEGRPRIAALDVFESEPPVLGALDPVRDRLILSPHMAWYTEESQADLRRTSAEEAARIIAGHPPRNLVGLPEAHP